jgi:formylglycine-generating enzyme required for sulfatase activity
LLKWLKDKAGVESRLPTEAEWEYTCRAGSQTRFHYGDDPKYEQIGRYAWYSVSADKATHPVGQKQPNPWGLFDMLGNAYEWCADRHGPYGVGEATDPVGPDSGRERVMRGGAWDSDPGYLRSACRYWNAPMSAHSLLGFRVVVCVAR